MPAQAITTFPPVCGTFLAPQITWYLRLLTKIGLSRGLIRRWIRHQWGTGIKRGKYPSQVDACIRGIRFRLDFVRNTTDRQLLTCSNHYDGKELRVLAGIVKQGSTDSVFVDVGANTGYYSLSMAKAGYSRVLAIEPNPPTLGLLRFNVAINDFSSAITITPTCVGTGGPVLFHCETSQDLGSAGLLGQSKGPPIMVESAPLLDILRTNHIEHVDSMKIDIEGYEDRALLQFFNTASKNLWPKIMVIEDCHRDLWETDIITHILSLGYRHKMKTRGNAILELTTT